MTLDPSPKIQLLGIPSVTVLGKSVTNFRSNRIPALLGLLSTERKQWQRERVAALLWPDSMPAEGRHNLRQTLLFSKQLLGDQVFIGDRNTIELSADIETDVQVLLQVNDSIRSSDEIVASAKLAVSIVKGDFLEGLYDEWIPAIRSQCAQAFLESLLILADHYMASEPTKALELAERAIETEPYLDGARVRKILALRKMGEDASAHQELRKYKQFLLDELGIEPSSAVLDAVKDRSDALFEPQDDQGSVPAIDPVSAVNILLGSSRPKHGLALAIAQVPFWVCQGTQGQGIEVMRKALDSLAKWPESPEIQEGQIALGELLAADGNLYGAKEVLSEIVPTITDRRVRMRGLLTYAKIYTVAYQAEAAQPYAKQALELALSVGSVEDKIDAYRTAAETAFLLEKLDEAETLADECTEFTRVIGDWQSIAHSWLLVATIRLRTGRLDEAKQAMAKALEELPENTTLQVSNIRGRFYRLIEELGDTAQAEKGYRAGIQEARGFGDQMGLSICLTYLGDLLTMRCKYPEALELHLEALAIRKTLREPLGEATSLRGIGRIYLASHEYVLAKDALKESCRLYLGCNSIPGHASSLVELARAVAGLGETALAYRVAVRSHNLLLGMSRLARLSIGPNGDSALREAEALVRSLQTP